MIRYLSIAALVLLPAALAGTPSQAQLAAAQPTAIQAETAAQKPPPADPARVKELIQTLNDPAQREKLIQQLTLLTQQQTAQKIEVAEPIGSRVLKFLTARMAEAGEEFGALGSSIKGLPAAERWFEHQLADPAKRARWAELANALVTVLAAGAVAFGLALLAIRRPRRARPGWRRRWPAWPRPRLRRCRRLDRHRPSRLSCWPSQPSSDRSTQPIFDCRHRPQPLGCRPSRRATTPGPEARVLGVAFDQSDSGSRPGGRAA